MSIDICILILRGTALSHHGSANSAFSTKQSAGIVDDMRSTTAPENEDESLHSHQIIERNHEIRRPRVSFSDFNKVQFFEENDDNTYQQSSTNRRHRNRSAKKLTSVILNTQVSPPSIQHSQTLYTPYRPLSRQQHIGHELNIRKQQLIPSPRAHTSRITHLPDILNQTLPHDTLVPQREKTFYQFPEPANENPINSSAEISRESTRAGGIRPTVNTTESFDQNDFTTNSFLNSSSITSSTTSRQRSNLRSISLRQQFISPIRLKQTNTQTVTNSRRSASFKNTILRNHSLDENQNDLSNQNFENRPMTGISPSRHSKRNYIIHFNSKNPFNGNATIDTYDSARQSSIKTNFHETSQENFQNLLKIVRPPYITNLHSSQHEHSLQTTTNHMNGSVRSSQTASEHTAHDYRVATNTIFV